MPELKPIHAESIPRAIAKAERYRLLNEPREAESICKDILALDADHQEATTILLLAVTDQFPAGHARLADAEAILPRLSDHYARHYYAGVALERWAKTLLAQDRHAAAAGEYLSAAMDSFDQAQRAAEPGNEDAVLRWNACARLRERHRLASHPGAARVEVEIEGFDDEVPPR